MKKLLSLALVLVMVLSCASFASAEEKLEGTITLMTFKANKDVEINAMVEAYEAAHPGVDIVVEYETDDNVVYTRFAAEDAADITFIPGSLNLTTTTYADYFLPLDDLGFDSATMVGLDGCRGADGKLYMVPGGVIYRGILYNKAVFKKLGLEAPKSLDEFWTVCETLKQNGVVPYCTTFINDGYTMDTQMCEVGDYYMASPNYRNEMVALDAPFSYDTNLQFVKIIRECIDRGYVEADMYSYTGTECTNDFIAGKLAMTSNGDYMVPYYVSSGMAEEDIGMFPYPGTDTLVVNTDICYAIYKGCKNVPLAKDFLKYMFGEGNFPARCGLTPPTVGAPVSAPVAELLALYPADKIITSAANSDDFNAIISEAEMDLHGFVQNLLSAADPQAVVDEYNAKWKQAKDELGL